MADYFTQFSFAFRHPPEELAAVAAALDDPTTFFMGADEMENYLPGNSFGVEYSIEGETMAIWADDCPEIEALAVLLQDKLSLNLPVTFTYMWGCSKLRVDEFGGGACVITKDEIKIKTTNDLIQEMLG